MPAIGLIVPALATLLDRERVLDDLRAAVNGDPDDLRAAVRARDCAGAHLAQLVGYHDPEEIAAAYPHAERKRLYRSAGSS